MGRFADVVDVLANATPQDLADLDEEIGRQEAALAALRLLRKALAAGVAAPPARGAPGGNGNGNGNGGHDPRDLKPARRRKAAELIAAHGPMKPAEIARRCGIPTGSLTAVLDCPEWFEPQSDGIHLTTLGRQAVRGGGDD